MYSGSLDVLKTLSAKKMTLSCLCERLFCRYVDHQRDMGVVLGERDIRREIMKHRGRLVKSKNLEMWTFCCQIPIAGEMCRSCQCTSDCGYFLPLLTSSCWKAHKWLHQNEGHNFSHLQQIFPPEENIFSINWLVVVKVEDWKCC